VACLLGSLLSGNAPAQEKPFTQPPIIAKPPPPVTDVVARTAGEAFTRGGVEANVMTRSETADQAGLEASHLLSVRPRVGFTTARYRGLQARLEGEAVVALSDPDGYNAAGSNGQPGRTVIADPETAEINQAWLDYRVRATTARIGRQRVVYDNSRWIGDVIWRQNQQTYDAAVLEAQAGRDTRASYAYIDAVRRIYGDVDDLPAANEDYASRSHLFHVEYTGLGLGRVVAYAYLLDLDNPATPLARDNSSATYGGFLQGSVTGQDGPGPRLNYRAEFAWQRDHGGSTLDYAAPYYAVELTAEAGRYSVGGGYEVLGSDGPAAVRAPLSTLHAFNGWADVFLTTPADGLRDLYATASIRLPGQVPLRVIYHRFGADQGPADYGHEWNVVASRRIARYFTGLVKYARYWAGDPFQQAPPPAAPVPAADKSVLWLQLEFAY
jgi:hypothetical protein